jgi:hypothetical protein
MTERIKEVKKEKEENEVLVGERRKEEELG